jgi:hypothetical protein
MRSISMPIILILLCGCTATYKHDTVLDAGVALVRGKSIGVVTPANGSYEGKEYANSGASTSLAIRAAFARFADVSAVLSECRDLACAMQQSPAYAYYVVPEILHWEDRATEWSGIKDKLEVKLSVYDGHTSEGLVTTIISGKSKWATLGGDHPQDLLSEPVDAFVRSLYGTSN